jgi:hypothetical protein
MSQIKTNYYQSSDLGCCAALITAGFVLRKIDKSNPKRVVFSFNLTDELSEASEAYLSDSLRVKARKYFENLRVIKSRIYGD